MSNVRITRTKSRLKMLAFLPGGMRAHEALEQADKAVQSQSAALIASVDGILSELDARFGAASPDGSVGDYEGLYGLASGIIDIAICLPGTLIDKAAFALCDLADLSSEKGMWDRQAVELHIMVLRLLRHGGPSMPMARRERVVEGLEKVKIKRLGVAP